MKRWFSLALAAALLMGLSAPARAADAEKRRHCRDKDQRRRAV